MNQVCEYEEIEIEEGITFKKVAYFFKKGWLRMVIYTAVLVLLAAAVALPIKSFYKSEPIATTTIEYIYNGIETGLAPDGSLLNTDHIVSTTVLSDAVAEANLGDVITDISALRAKMRVEGVDTDEYVALVEAAANGDTEAANTLRNYKMYPTSFNIVISQPESLGLSDAQSEQLLNKIVQCYYRDFQKRYTVTDMFATDTFNLSQNKDVEFVDIYDIYSIELDSVKAFLDELIVQNPKFVSYVNNTSFSQLSSELNLLISNYSRINAYVLSNNVWRNKAAAQSALKASKEVCEINIQVLSTYIDSLKDQISKILPNTTTSDGNGMHNVTVTYPAEYYVYQRQLNEAYLQMKEYELQLANIDARLAKVTDTTATDGAYIEAAAKQLEITEATTVTLIKKINATVEDYYKTAFIAASVRQVRMPIVTRRSAGFNVLIVFASAVFVALVAAGIVTAVKISTANAKRAKRAEEQAERPADDGKTEEQKN